MAQDFAILDIGSKCVTVLIGERGVNNTINIIGMGDADYDGYCNGKWFAVDQLSYVVGHAIAKAEANSRTKINHLCIGVPAEFTVCGCKNADINFTKRHKITDDDIEQLHAQGNKFDELEEFTLINSQPIYYTIDDERRLIQPIGLASSKIGGHISYMFAENTFITLFDRIMKEQNIVSYDYCSSILAETLFLFDDIKRDMYVVLIDIGHLTSSVVVGRGDGLLSLQTFGLGGGHIAGDLMAEFDISFTEAEQLKRKVVLSLDCSDDDVYEIGSKDDKKTFSAKKVGEVVLKRLDMFAKLIEDCLNSCDYDYPNYIPYHLTGGGVSYIPGAKDILAKKLGRQVEIVSPRLPQLNRPHLSSSLGLLDMVLKQEIVTPRKGFFSKLFGK